MKVWVVGFIPDDGVHRTIQGVFSSEELAANFVVGQSLPSKWYEVSEHEVEE